MMVREWVRVLKNDGVKVSLIDPGWFASNLGGGTTEKAKEMGKPEAKAHGEFIKEVIEGGSDEHLGRLAGMDGPLPW